MADLRIATRASSLALAQARRVADALRAAHEGMDVSLVEVTTTGDADRTTPVTALTELGAFVRAVQVAVLEGRADLAVHSAKDLPTAPIDGLVPTYPERDVPWDALCGATPDGLAPGAKVGTGSPRRTAQLKALRPDVEVVAIRGNVETRLEKVGKEVDAVVLAAAGLIRLGLESEITHLFTADEMVPAPAQAALCVETSEAVAPLVTAIDDPHVRRTVEAERLLLSETGAGCRSALGAFATATADGLTMTTFVEDDAGPRRATVAGEDARALVTSAREGLGL